jgi:hypothetical protein
MQTTIQYRPEYIPNNYIDKHLTEIYIFRGAKRGFAPQEFPKNTPAGRGRGWSGMRALRQNLRKFLPAMQQNATLCNVYPPLPPRLSQLYPRASVVQVAFAGHAQLRASGEIGRPQRRELHYSRGGDFMSEDPVCGSHIGCLAASGFGSLFAF